MGIKKDQEKSDSNLQLKYWQSVEACGSMACYSSPILNPRTPMFLAVM